MKSNNSVSALATTAQALGVVSQLLAIGIEAGIIAGGIYIYKKVADEFKPEPEKVAEIPEGMQLVPIEQEKKKTSWKERWDKVKKIVKAVTE